MSIRYKLLILLLFISLVPLLSLGAVVRRDLTRMGEDLAVRSENVLIHKASTGLTRIVKDHARVLGRERLLLESTTLFLASKIEGVLYGHSHLPRQTAFSPSEEQIGSLAGEYYTLRMGRLQSLAVDFRKLSVSPAGRESDLPDKLMPLLGQVKFDLPQLALWVEIRFPGGTEMVYPGVNAAARMHMGMNGSMGSMSGADTALSRSLKWSRPQIDARTGRSAFRVSAPVRDIRGGVEAEVSIVIPVDALLSGEHQASMFSANTKSFLVAAGSSDGKDGRIRVIAREQSGRSMGRHWELPSDSWLDSPDREQYARAVDALRGGTPMTVGMPYEGREALWAFAPVNPDGTALMLIVPRSDVIAEAVTAKEYVLAQVDRHNAKMGFFALVVIVFVLTLAMLLSRLFTRNIAALAGAVRSVAKGDFSARADVGGTDEIGQLGQAFNGMVPELRERVALKSALEVAQQVQQSLLPEAAPDFAGADIAAASEYCDETGGDYYDFIPCGNNGEDGGESLVIAVGDVSGHGIPAALMMSSARAYLHCQNRRGQSLDQVAETVNGLLHADMDMSGRFMTLFLLELTHGGPLRWVRAGHDPALLYDPARDNFRELDGQGLPLGVVEVAGLELCEEPAPPSGAVIAVGTDGIWERRSPDGEMFGKERMRDVIRAHADEPAREIIRALLKELEEFGGRTEQEDDITIVIIKTA